MWQVSGTALPSPSSGTPIKLPLKFPLLSLLVPCGGRTPFWAMEPQYERKHHCFPQRCVSR